MDRALANAEIKAMITAFGGGYGEEFNIDKLRYHRIVCMTDADVDGSAHPHSAADLLLPLHASSDRKRLRLRQPMPPLYKVTKGQEGILRLRRQRAGKTAERHRPRRQAGHSALQRPGRDEFRAALADHHEPGDPHHDADHGGGRHGGGRNNVSTHGREGRAPARSSSSRTPSWSPTSTSKPRGSAP